MNKEIIDLLEKRQKMAIEEAGQRYVYLSFEEVKEILTFLKQQPSAGEFTILWREKLDNAIFLFKMGRNADTWFQSIVTGFNEACEIIDRSKSSRKELVKALKRYGHHDSPCAGILDLNEDSECTCGFEAAIAKAKKER